MWLLFPSSVQYIASKRGEFVEQNDTHFPSLKRIEEKQ